MIPHGRKRGSPATMACNPEIMSGVTTVHGTCILVEMILLYLRAGRSRTTGNSSAMVLTRHATGSRR
jgi:hypothetical protein